MPEHTSFFTYLLNAIFGHTALEENMRNFGHTISGKPVGAHAAEPLVASLFVVLLSIVLAYRGRAKVIAVVVMIFLVALVIGLVLGLRD